MWAVTDALNNPVRHVSVAVLTLGPNLVRHDKIASSIDPMFSMLF